MDESRKAVLALWNDQLPASLEARPFIHNEWLYSPGVPAEGLVVTIQEMPSLDSVVTLPHRIVKPDWPMWYQRVISFEEGDWLYVNGDDGVQVFQQDQVLEPEIGDFFKLLIGADSALITIRVLNNAVAGGLRDVRLVSGDDFNTYRDTRSQRLAMKKVLYEAMRTPNLRRDQQERLVQMLESPSDETIEAARALFGTTLQLPYLPGLLVEPDAGEGFSFTAWGDSQGGWNTFQQLVAQMMTEPAAFSIGLGDLVGHGAKEEQWLAFTAALQPMLNQQAVFLIPGNHDYDGYYNDLIPDLYDAYTRKNPGTESYFSWTYGGAFFMALDPNRTFPLGFDQQQLDWMFDQMNSDAWQEAHWRFLLMHQAPYAQGWPGYHGDAFIREMVDSLAAPYRIDFVLTGHNHDYEHLALDYGDQQTNFFIFGGAGGGLEPPENSSFPEMDTIIKAHHFARLHVSPSQVHVRVFGVDGDTLDSLVVE